MSVMSTLQSDCLFLSLSNEAEWSPFQTLSSFKGEVAVIATRTPDTWARRLAVDVT